MWMDQYQTHDGQKTESHYYWEPNLEHCLGKKHIVPLQREFILKKSSRPFLYESQAKSIKWIYRLNHVGIRGNESADLLQEMPH